ncbi:nitrate reductase [Aquibium carbonis]|nr:nitrate reductase [Aquibium carbonis]
MSRLVNPLAPRRAVPERTRQIKDWVRQLHALDDDVTVSVTELACGEEGCPDIETVIGIMRPGQKIETLRVHKPIAEVEREDIGSHG